MVGLTPDFSITWDLFWDFQAEAVQAQQPDSHIFHRKTSQSELASQKYFAIRHPNPTELKMNDGKHLEALVAFVEETMLPQGFDVKTNQCIRNDEGIQIAEFDVEIRGKLGTTNLAWLIECRDRPSAGAAPSSWIEQLVGRRTRFGFNKVTAVSTTGFTEGARQFAKNQGIELRVVEYLNPDAFSWLQLGGMIFTENRSSLEKTNILINENTPDETRSAVANLVEISNGSTEILKSTKTGKLCTLAQAFLGAIENQKLFDNLIPNDPPIKIKLHVNYVGEDDYFVIETKSGEARVNAIIFQGELSAIQSNIPILKTSEYRNIETGELISQVASFAPQNINGSQLTIDFHRMGEDGETCITVRKT